MAFSAEKKAILDEAAISCIILDSRPWGDFKRSGMQKFLSAAIPGYTGPSSRTVQRRLSKLYCEIYQKFKDELAKINNLSITADIWQNKRKHHYLCITGHWIDSNFNLQSKILSFRQFKGRHLAVRIRRNMCRTINNFNLKGKIVATTTDNGANVQAASSQMSLFGIRIHCFAHALNLVVQNSLLLWPKKKRKTEQAENNHQEET